MQRDKKWRLFLLVVFASARASAASSPDQGLVGWWQMEEGIGRTAADASGNGNSGTLINHPLWTTGPSGRRALAFHGNTYVTVNASRSLANLYTTGMTVAAWIKPTNPGGGYAGRIVEKMNNWFLAMYAPSATDVKVQFKCEDSAGAIRSHDGAIKLDAWQHVVATWDGNGPGDGMHIYVNGVPADGASVNGNGRQPTDDASHELIIGNRTQGRSPRGFEGSISDVRVYNRTLSAGEIRSLASLSPPVRSARAEITGPSSH
jgi:hypothetical protein